MKGNKIMPDKKIIHLSDLHVGRRKKESDGTKKLFELISKDYPQIPVLITGDLTDSAKLTQFKNTRSLLDELAKTNPILAVPGNHDYAWKGNFLRDDGWENWVQHLGSPLGWQREEVPWMGVDYEPERIDGLGIWQDGPVVYFGIDSGDPLDKQISARGFISKGLASSLSEVLKTYNGKTRIAMLHHHPFTEGFFTKLKGSKLLMNALANNCELLLFGHEHEYGIWRDSRDIPLIESSHKSTDNITGDCLIMTIIEIRDAGTPGVTFEHRLEVV